MHKGWQKVAAGFTGAMAIAACLVMPHEGFRNQAYSDPVQIPTICWGHTQGVQLGQVATDAECAEFLKADLQEAERILNSAVKVPLPVESRAAFLSFIYNVGPGKKGVKDGFLVLKSGRPSTMLLKLRAGDIEG